jgi:hypothetical protein
MLVETVGTAITVLEGVTSVDVNQVCVTDAIKGYEFS